MRDKKPTRLYDIPGDELKFLGDGLRLRAQMNKINENVQWLKYFTVITTTVLLSLK